MKLFPSSLLHIHTLRLCVLKHVSASTDPYSRLVRCKVPVFHASYRMACVSLSYLLVLIPSPGLVYRNGVSISEHLSLPCQCDDVLRTSSKINRVRVPLTSIDHPGAMMLSASQRFMICLSVLLCKYRRRACTGSTTTTSSVDIVSPVVYPRSTIPSRFGFAPRWRLLSQASKGKQSLFL